MGMRVFLNGMKNGGRVNFESVRKARRCYGYSRRMEKFLLLGCVVAGSRIIDHSNVDREVFWRHIDPTSSPIIRID